MTHPPHPRWRDAVSPPPPAALAAAVESHLASPNAASSDAASSDAAAPGAVTPEAYLDAAQRLLAALLKQGCVSRENALDLLVADALVTYAFEAASDETPAAIIQRAHDAMVRIAAFAVPADA